MMSRENSRVSISSVLVQGHRWFGYAFLALYVFFLWQMAPRLWTYQIEFPARTVVHFALGMALGPLLLLKILVVRFLPRFEANLAPSLGVILLVGATVLIGLSAPFALQESAQAWGSATGGFLSEASLQRVESLLTQTELDEEARRQLASPAGLLAGRDVLRQQCVECHDLRTVLARPRTPDNWRSTVRRMADRTTMFNPLSEEQQWEVTAYLVAVSPQLQQSAQQMRAQQTSHEQSQQAAQAVTTPEKELATVDPGAAKQMFEMRCSECHGLELVDQSSLRSENDVRSLVARMVEEGLTATEDELGQIVQHLTMTYVPAARD